MKNPDDIKARLSTLLTQEFEKRTQEATQRLPRRCRHNHQQVLDARKNLAGDPNDGYNRVDRTGLPVLQSIGLCGLGMEDAGSWNGDVCDEPVDAQRCPHFLPKQDKAELLETFKQQVMDPEWLRENLPEAYALLWVLEDAAPNYHLPWWKRLWFRFWRIRIEPAHPMGDGMWVEVKGHLVGVGSDDALHSS